MQTSGRAMPAQTKDTSFFWEGTKKHQLLVRACAKCSRRCHPPLPACPACLSFDWNVVESSREGVVHSFVVTHHPLPPGVTEPYAVVLIDLEQDVRVITAWDGAVDEITVGERVEIGFSDQEEGFTILTARARRQEIAQ